ncbi:MAG: PAS domain S-box protein [Oleiphilaceae bacterium]|nr:PAS domain S-box protein [Oleiphilaceae bacterium]
MPSFLSRLFPKSQHAHALEQAPQAIVSINERDVVTFFNAAAEQLWGHTRDKVLGQPSTRLFTTSDFKAASREKGQAREVQLTAANGRTFWAELAASMTF